MPGWPAIAGDDPSLTYGSLIREYVLVDYKQPSAVGLPSHYLGTKPVPSIPGSMTGPCCMQHRQSFTEFEHCTCFQFHVTAARENMLVGLANRLMPNRNSTTGHEPCIGLIQGCQAFDISAIKGIEKKNVDFLRSVRRHSMR